MERHVPKIYLAGPISGLTYDDAQEWRDVARKALLPEIEAFSPLRNKQYLRDVGVLQQSYAISPMSTDRGIMTRDHFDCMTSDLILCYLKGATQLSAGTIMEIGWAFAYRKPLVVVIEPNGNPHDHPMIREAIGYRVEELDHAIHVVRAVLLPAYVAH